MPLVVTYGRRRGRVRREVADGNAVAPSGLVDVPVTVQLILRLEDGTDVHWDRTFTLRNVWVLDLGTSSPRDLYVSWADFGSPSTPLVAWLG